MSLDSSLHQLSGSAIFYVFQFQLEFYFVILNHWASLFFATHVYQCRLIQEQIHISASWLPNFIAWSTRNVTIFICQSGTSLTIETRLTKPFARIDHVLICQQAFIASQMLKPFATDTSDFQSFVGNFILAWTWMTLLIGSAGFPTTVKDNRLLRITQN